MEGDYNEISIKVKIPFHRRTSLNYTHTVYIDSQINLISTWRKSKTKFNINLFKNIFTHYFIPNYILNYTANHALQKKVIFSI